MSDEQTTTDFIGADEITRMKQAEIDHPATADTNAGGWCKRCGCGNDVWGYRHLTSCPTRTMTELTTPQTTERRPIKVGDKLLCDGGAFGCQTFNNYPCTADEPERMIGGRLHVGTKDGLGVAHLYPVERFHHAE